MVLVVKPAGLLGRKVRETVTKRGKELIKKNRRIRAEHLEALDRFDIDHAYPSWPVNRWLTAMVRLFRPQMVVSPELIIGPPYK